MIVEAQIEAGFEEEDFDLEEDEKYIIWIKEIFEEIEISHENIRFEFYKEPEEISDKKYQDQGTNVGQSLI